MTARRLHLFQPDLPGESGTTFSEILAAFLTDQQSELNPETFADRRRTGEKFAQDFGIRSYKTIRPSEVKAWILGRPEWKEKNTRWAALLALKRIFNWALLDRMIDFNPIAGLSLPRGRTGQATAEREFQTMLRGTDAYFRRPLIFLRATGCRPQDFRNLEWPWIDWLRSVAVIPPDKHKTGKKTGKPKILPLTRTAIKLLVWLRRRCEGLGHVFLNSQGKPWTRVAIAQRMLAIRQNTGLAKSVKLHGVRHLFGTAGVGRGGNIKLISQALGHDRVSTTEQFYLHLEAREIEAILEAAELAAKRPDRIK